MADWMRSESYRWKGGTRVRYRGLVSQHIVPFLGNRVVVSLKARDIQDFYTTLREQGRSESTIASVHSVLTAVFAYGIDVHELEMPKNPCDRVKLPRAKKAEVKVMVDEFPQGQVPGEGGRQKQAGIGHQAMVVKEDADTVGFVLWQHLLGAPCFRAGFCSKTIIPDSEEHPLASSRAVPKAVLLWIRA